MTTPDLTNLERLLAEATERPWTAGNHWPAGWIMAEGVKKGPMHVAEMRGWGYLTGRGHGALGLTSLEAARIQDANAALIVEAINALPSLISRIRSLQGALEKKGLVIPELPGVDAQDAPPKAMIAGAFSMAPWRNVQLMAGAGIEQTEEDSAAWNLFAAIHRFACEQQAPDRGDPINEARGS